MSGRARVNTCIYETKHVCARESVHIHAFVKHVCPRMCKNNAQLCV